MALPGDRRSAASSPDTPHSAAMSFRSRPAHSGCGTLEAMSTRPSIIPRSVRIMVEPAVYG
ncbi:hypothetical protein D3C87_1140060 [compost metagenome]